MLVEIRDLQMKGLPVGWRNGSTDERFTCWLKSGTYRRKVYLLVEVRDRLKRAVAGSCDLDDVTSFCVMTSWPVVVCGRSLFLRNEYGSSISKFTVVLGFSAKSWIHNAVNWKDSTIQCIIWTKIWTNVCIRNPYSEPLNAYFADFTHTNC